MPLTKFPNGVSSYGIPQLGNGELVPTTTGSVFFVSSATGDSANPGLDPGEPLATIDQAINKCAANKGDVIIVMPGHAETISNSTSLVPDVAGITIVGLGNGSDQPEITFDNTASEIIISGESTTIKNFRFVAGVSAIVTGVDVDANHVSLEGCTWDFSTTAFDFLIMADIDAFDYTRIVGCTFRAENATAGAARAIRIDDANHLLIQGNLFTGDYSAAAIEQASADAPGINLMILDNVIYNDDTANADNGIAFQEADTGIIARNIVGTLTAGTTATTIDPGSCLCCENYVVNAIDETGVVVPITVST